jgi:hypothetical protein
LVIDPRLPFMPQPPVPDAATRDAVAAFRTHLMRRYGERLRGLVLFGSRARGDARAGSDADLAVFLDPICDPIEAQMDMAGDAYGVFLETGILIQPWAFGGAPDRPAQDRALGLLRSVQAVGIVL